MRIEFAYGDGFLPLDTGRFEKCDYIQPKIVVEHTDIRTEIYRKIENSGLLSRILRNAKSSRNTTIVMDHPERFADPKTQLEAIISAFELASIDPTAISLVLILPEAFRSDLDSLMPILGTPASLGVQLMIHEEQRESSLRYLGDAPDHDIPVWLNKAYSDASLRIVLSTVAPSILTGATGGLTSIALGISGQKTAAQIHKLMTVESSELFYIHGPVGRTIASVAEFCAPDLSINTIQDNMGNIAQTVVGPSSSSWESAISVSRELSSVRIDRRSDIAIVGTGGKGIDATLYDAIECLHAGFCATRTGGTILLIAECAYGAGPEGFIEGVASARTPAELETIAATNFRNGMERSKILLKTLESRNIILCSRLRESLVSERLQCIGVRDPQEGFELALLNAGTNARTAIIENGSNINLILSK
ncbi:MAG: lactate racemase domain-containing protein [Candidatus Thorarchaeota archaeon]